MIFMDFSIFSKREKNPELLSKFLGNERPADILLSFY